VLVVDSSVAVAAFASWNEHHKAARQVMARSPRLVAHAALETYSVLTRLPPPHRAPADLVHQFLAEEFPAQWLALPGPRYRALLKDLASGSVVGGAVYDALIAAVASSHKATLASCDRRARATYEAVGARVEFIG
jgi:predicted nucleic acid-binding protein